MWLRFPCFFFIALLLTVTLYSQSKPVQIIRGQVVEQFIRNPIPFATIKISGKDALQFIADSTGSFSSTPIPTGRYSITISAVGFKLRQISNLLVEAGKELVLTVDLEENRQDEQSVVVRATRNKALPINQLIAVSARMFSVEETRRFAAGINDPSRIAVAFPGVAANGDGNALVIRGNAPNGLLWRMEGIDIPNPNHFSRVGTSGGGISILSAQLLANSDFITGAFPAEYGNAMSGVFDIRLRKGNAQKREHTFSISTIGIDAATEGYFRKGGKSSYLINYRYGFLTLMQQLGLNVGDQPTAFQDLSFNCSFPIKRVGKFGFFGLGGKSQQTDPAFADSVRWTSLVANRSGNIDQSNTGVVGLSHELTVRKKLLWQQVLSLNAFKYREDDFNYAVINGPLIYTRKNAFSEHDINFKSTVTYKLNPKHLLKFGIYGSLKNFNLQQRESVSSVLRDKVRVAGTTQLLNYFWQWKWSPVDRLQVMTGFHGQWLSLNKSSSFEPRIGLRYQTAPGQFLTGGVGWHSQLQPLGNYYARIRSGNDTIQPNLSLGFSKANHIVIGYSIQFAPNWNLKTELYYQWLYHIPVTAGSKTSYSVLNLEDDYAITPLANTGAGKNSGIEVTLERWWNDQFYLLSTLSLYNSIYKGSDGIWRSTRFNANRSFTLATGKEWKLKTKKPTTFSIDLKVLNTGGQRVTPINIPISFSQGRTVLYTNRIYEEKLADFFRVDAQFEWRIQYRKHTIGVIGGVQNLLNRKNAYNHFYNAQTKKVDYSTLQGIIPVLGCKIDW